MRDSNLAVAVRDWADTVPAEVGGDRIASRLSVLTSVTRLLLVVTEDQRTVHLREPSIDDSPPSIGGPPPDRAGPSA